MKTLLILLTAFQDWSLSGDTWDFAATEATTAWDLHSDEKGGDSISEPSGELVNESSSNTQASDQPSVVSAQDGYYVVMYTASWCGPCQQWKAAGNLERMRELGHPVTVVDIDKNPQYRGSVPRFEIIERGTGRRVWKVTGGVSPQTIVGNIPTSTTPVHVPPIRQRLPVVNTQWGTIDLETYQRNCNCPMCQGIRALQQQYRQTSYTPAVLPAQEPTPSTVIRDLVAMMQLTERDVLADIGCGDGRILIESVKRYGCSGIGIEIDASKADEARRNIEAAGLSTRIEIITGDARTFEPQQHGVTHAVAYLYPELLQELAPMLSTIPKLYTPFHKVPGLAMEKSGDVWVRRQ